MALGVGGLSGPGLELGIWESAEVSVFARSAGGRKWNREFWNPGLLQGALGGGSGIGNFGILGLQGALGAGIGLGNLAALRALGAGYGACGAALRASGSERFPNHMKNNPKPAACALNPPASLCWASGA